MLKITVHNLEGEKTGELDLPANVFALEANPALLHQVYTVMMGNQRQVIAHTKDRSERKGSGRKPWKQKGTGNARTGDIRNPIWRGGGITFGPTKERNFKKNINVKMKQKATKIALSEKVRSKKLIVLEDLDLNEYKTKELAQVLTDLKIKGKSVLLGLTGKKESKVKRIASNLEKVDTLPAEYLNVLELLNHQYLILSKESVKKLEEKFSK